MSKYIADFEKKAILLPIDEPPMNNNFRERAIRDGFSLKDEFHITVLHPSFYSKIGEEGFQNIAHNIVGFTEPSYSFVNKVFFLAKTKRVANQEYPRESLIAPVEADNIINDIERAFSGLKLRPFLHATLFTRQDNPWARAGIGIPDSEEWGRLNPKLYFEDWLSQ